jgi:hypothetical protein
MSPVDWSRFAKRHDAADEPPTLTRAVPRPAVDLDPKRIARGDKMRARNLSSREAKARAVADYKREHAAISKRIAREHVAATRKQSVESCSSSTNDVGAQRLQTQSSRNGENTRVSENCQNSIAPEKNAHNAHDKWASWMFRDDRTRVTEETAKIAPRTIGASDVCPRCHWVSDADVSEHGDSSRVVREQELRRSGFELGDCGWFRRCDACASQGSAASALLDAEGAERGAGWRKGGRVSEATKRAERLTNAELDAIDAQLADAESVIQKRLTVGENA